MIFYITSDAQVKKKREWTLRVTYKNRYGSNELQYWAYL